MTKSVVLLFSLIFSVSAFAERDHELPLEQWSDADSNQVFAVLDEDLNNEEHEEYEEVQFDERGRVININRETQQHRGYEEERKDDYFAHASHQGPRYNTRRHRDSYRHRDSRRRHRDSRRRQHRRRPVVVVPPPIFVHPPLVSNICRSGLGNGFYFCYFVDGRPRTVGSRCSCYLRNVYTGARIFFKGRVSPR